MRIHNNINPYKCKFCDRKFRFDSNLKVVFIVNIALFYNIRYKLELHFLDS